MKKIKLLLLAAIGFANVHAQKLPKIQTASVRAPQNIQVDGKLTEWNDQFQAYIPGSRIYYTISNDENNLYLTARMDDMAGNIKVFKGGINFSIIPLAKKADKILITFPVISREQRDKMEDGGGVSHLNLYKRLKADPVANKEKIAALVASSNSDIRKTYKQIYITGIPGVDTLTAIYNTQNIMVGAGFDNKMRYTYELAIPLKYLEAAINDVKSIKYNIRLRTQPVNAPRKVRNVSGPGLALIDPNARPFTMDELYIFEDSDFSGEYTLAK